MRIETILPPKRVRYQANLQSTTLRGFDRGWNVLDDDMNLSYKYATLLDNCFPASDGSIKVRFGFERFAAAAAFFSSSTTLVDMTYFNNALIAVGANGEIIKVLGDGTVSRIWDAAIAAALAGAPAGWSATDFVSFAVFNGHLIICNGIDKPLDIDSNFVVEYLQDAATNTNINVPICKYVAQVGRYLVMAGDPLTPDMVHISARDAAGTWFGDPPPNDATRLEVGSVIAAASVIRGLMEFRGRLIVMFAEGLVFGQLGTYEGVNHAPNFDDGVTGYGSISHRAAVAYGDDGLFMDLEGVPSIKRTVLSTSFKPERVSELIDTEIKAMLRALSFEAMENRAFSVYNKAEGQFMLFVPNAETVADTTETIAFVYNFRPALQQAAWCRFRGMNFTCGARSLQSNVFFGDADCNIWLYGNDGNPIYQDYMVEGVGTAIAFDWTMPWFDLGQRTRTKQTKYISFDTRGASEFNVQMYVDNFLSAPALETEFSAGEQGEFGGGPQPYGGGRNTARKKHHGWPTKFLIGKLRFYGEADEGLAFVSISLHYSMGGINR